MKVTSMPEVPLVERVLHELRALRRDSAGVRVETLARATAICQVLGAGDPYLAYTRLQHALLDASLDRTIRAAAASLGFAGDGDTHLDRLVEGGEDLHLEQRQVRRLSDQGLTALARMIATNWAVESVPRLTAILVSYGAGAELHVSTRQSVVVQMREPVIELLSGPERLTPTLEWRSDEDLEAKETSLLTPVRVDAEHSETSLVIVWRGELWPKFAFSWQGVDGGVVETLGNKAMLRLFLPRG
ncbi:MAG: hypothetical protein KF761_11215 [Salinibacterium sp.]|nr:hypothetical protein [Salinibacterium sp.]